MRLLTRNCTGAGTGCEGVGTRLAEPDIQGKRPDRWINDEKKAGIEAGSVGK